MSYSYVTLASAQQDLVYRLYDPQNQFGAGSFFWGAAELTLYIQEAIRTWNALANYFRAEFTFPLVQGTVWYDITNTTVAPSTLRPQTLTDNSLTQIIEYHLIEPLTTTYPLVWTGSNQFNIAQIVSSLTAQRQAVLGTTGCQITQTLVSAVPGRTFLADTVVDIRRIAWLPNAGLGFSALPLYPIDIQGEQDFDYLWTTKPTGQPSQFLVSTEPPLSFDVDRGPAVAGNYEVLSASAGQNFLLSQASLLGIPDDWAWLIKWGALGDLLNGSSSPNDTIRGSYCRRRFEDGLTILKASPAVLGLRLNNVPLPYDSVRNGDDFNPGWQATAQGTPSIVYLAGLNLLGFPPPDAGVYTITVNCVQNAPIPVASGDFLQIGRDDYQTIIDYAQHLAAFKIGGKFFENTLSLFQNFLARAALYNSKLIELGIYQKPIYEISQLNTQRNPVFREE